MTLFQKYMVLICVSLWLVPSLVWAKAVKLSSTSDGKSFCTEGKFSLVIDSLSFWDSTIMRDPGFPETLFRSSDQILIIELETHHDLIAALANLASCDKPMQLVNILFLTHGNSEHNSNMDAILWRLGNSKVMVNTDRAEDYILANHYVNADEIGFSVFLKKFIEHDRPVGLYVNSCLTFHSNEEITRQRVLKLKSMFGLKNADIFAPYTVSMDLGLSGSEARFGMFLKTALVIGAAGVIGLQTSQFVNVDSANRFIGLSLVSYLIADLLLLGDFTLLLYASNHLENLYIRGMDGEISVGYFARVREHDSGHEVTLTKAMGREAASQVFR